jgi:hypothetical protein
MSDPFLEQFERRRVAVESQILRMPTAAHIVQRWGGPNGLGQQYLHALPTMCTLIEIMAKSPRTAGTFRDRVERHGPCKFRIHEVEKCFTCLGLGYIYRLVAKRTNDPELGNLLTRVGTLALLSPADLEKIDWVTRSFSATLRDGSKDSMAPANLLLWWLTGGEHPQRALQVDHMLQRYFDFLQSSLEMALQHQINMSFPW